MLAGAVILKQPVLLSNSKPIRIVFDGKLFGYDKKKPHTNQKIMKIKCSRMSKS